MTNDQPEFDKFISALRSSAHADELVGEGAALDAMASTVASTPAAGRSFGSARSIRVVAVVAASLIGMGGIAAAGAATLRPARDNGEISSADIVVDTGVDTAPDTVADTPILDTVVDETVPVTTVPVTTVHVSTDPGLLVEPLVDDPDTEFDETQCADGNHGATVSSIAKETPPGPGHGDVVSEAAHSSCGKDATTDDTIADDTVDAPLVDDPDTEFDETQCADGNHGATVSSIAKQTPPGPGHGDVVSEAAHSSCGKDATTDDTIADDGTDTTTVAATEDDSPGNSAGHGNSNGRGNGNGNSGGNGNGRGNGKPGG